MLMGSFRWGCVVLMLAASVCMGQEQRDDDKGKAARKRIKSHAREQGRIGLSPRPEYLIKELNLDEDQAAAVRRICKEHKEKMRELRETFTQFPEMREKLKELHDAKRAAREAGDEDRLREVRDEIRALQEERRQKMAPVQEQMKALQKAHYEDLLAVMREDQKKRFEELWEEWTEPRFGGPRRSPRALKAVVEKLPDLAPEQKQQIEELFSRHKEATRETEKNTPECRKLTKQLYDDVIKVLTPEQKEKVEKKLRGRRSEDRRMHDRGPRGPRGPRGQDRP